MSVHQATLTVRTPGQGTHEITGLVAREVQRSGVKQGVVPRLGTTWKAGSTGW